MKKSQFTPVLLAIAALVGACSSMPESTSLLDQTRTDYVAAQNNPNVATYASVEMKQAGEALQQTNAAAENHDGAEKIDKLAYLAKQKIALTQEVAKRKSAEADVVNAGKERDQVRLDQRTIEADQAKMRADQSDLAAQAAQSRTAQLEAQLADLSARKTDRGFVITLGDVLFGTDMALLNPDGMRTAQKLAYVLKHNPERTVLVEGFTDSTGSAAHNQQLSERRADAVRASLLEMGVPANRVAIHGYGEASPVASNNTAQSRQLNRRVEIVLSDENGIIPPR